MFRATRGFKEEQDWILIVIHSFVWPTEDLKQSQINFEFDF